jgi:hypothetical protein
VKLAFRERIVFKRILRLNIVTFFNGRRGDLKKKYDEFDRGNSDCLSVIVPNLKCGRAITPKEKKTKDLTFMRIIKYDLNVLILSQNNSIKIIRINNILILKLRNYLFLLVYIIRYFLMDTTSLYN